MAKLPLGKGYYIWQIGACEGGNVDQIAATAKAIGLGHVYLKVADGTYAYNGAYNLVRLISLLHNYGIQVYGWQYIYGVDPLNEAKRAVERCKVLGLDGFIVDAEKEFKQTGWAARATTYMTYLKDNLGGLPIGLASYRYPSYHPEFPWKAFRAYASFDAPQVYWEGAHNPSYQLEKSWGEFRGLTPQLPYIPTGAAYKTLFWSATADDVRAFMAKAVSLKFTGFNFWEWGYTRKNLPAVWQAIAEYNAPQPEPTPPPSPDYEARLNKLETALAYLQERLNLAARPPVAWYKPSESQAIARFAASYNARGKPVMQIYPSDNAPVSQRIFLTGRFRLSPIPVIADGGGLYYPVAEPSYYSQINDPGLTLYVRDVDVSATVS